MTDAPNYVYSIFSFVGFLLVCIPLRWHLEAWNTGTCLYMIWTGLGCLNSFINSIVWNKNVDNSVPIWCDISSHFIIALSVAVPASSLCINRRLYLIATIQSTTMKTKAQKRREIMVDLAICLGIPLLEIGLGYIVQGHRFNIFEDIGCFPAIYNTPVTYPLVFCWPVAIGLVSAVYCSLTIRAFVKRRSELNKMFVGIKNLNPNRHLRLMGLAGTELMLGIPCSVYICLYLNISSNGSAESPINPYINWDNVHLEFSRVDKFPAIEWKQNPDAILNLELARWSNVVCAFIFFGWFGFAQEARKNYRLAFDYVTKKVGSLTAIHSGLSNSSASKQPMTSTNCGTIPFFISRQATFKPSFPVDIRPEGVGSTLDYIKRPHSHADSASGSSRSICEKSASITPPPDTFDAASPFH